LSAFSFPVPADILLDNLSACWRRVPVSAKWPQLAGIMVLPVYRRPDMEIDVPKDKNRE
jgi:hypothetical protein